LEFPLRLGFFPGHNCAAVISLTEEDASLLAQAARLGRTLFDLRKIDATAAPLLSLHEQAVANFQELQRELSAYSDRLEVDPARLKELEERIDLLHSLKRKYGSTLAEVIAFGEAARHKLNNLDNATWEIAGSAANWRS